MGKSILPATPDGIALASPLAIVQAVGGCTDPIKLLATPSFRVDGNTGEILSSSSTSSSDDVVLADPSRSKEFYYTRCNNRRHAKCPSCSDVYKSDIWHVIQSGIKDASVPLTFVTLTAPGMGCQHHIAGSRCTPKAKCAKCGKDTKCGKQHAEDSSLVGVPVCGCFNYQKAATWNMLSARLWNDFITRYRRAYRKLHKDQTLAVPFFRVVEHHKRGVAHHHLLLRGLHSKKLVRECIAKSGIEHEGVRYTYGDMCDVQRLYKGDTAARNKVANYFSKYLTKSMVDEVRGKGALGRHLEQLRRVAGEVAKKQRPLCSSPIGHLHENQRNKQCRCGVCHQARLYRRRAAERLGHAGQVCSKSSAHSGDGRWGKTLRECREARRLYKRSQAESTLFLAWDFVGQGWGDSPVEVKLARLAAFLTDAGERPPPRDRAPAVSAPMPPVRGGSRA
jgi:hypothetical protein